MQSLAVRAYILAKGKGQKSQLVQEVLKKECSEKMGSYNYRALKAWARRRKLELLRWGSSPKNSPRGPSLRFSKMLCSRSCSEGLLASYSLLSWTYPHMWCRLQVHWVPCHWIWRLDATLTPNSKGSTFLKDGNLRVAFLKIIALLCPKAYNVEIEPEMDSKAMPSSSGLLAYSWMVLGLSYMVHGAWPILHGAWPILWCMAYGA